MINIPLSSPFWIGLRRVMRRLGIAQFISRFMRRSEYEERFSRLLLENVRRDDCVWDVGANVGHYTSRIAARLGTGGRVIAFEPAPNTFAVLSESARGGAWPNVVLRNLALGSSTGDLAFVLTGGAGEVTNHVAAEEPKAGGQSVIRVPAYSADDLLSREPQLAPNIIKIDVEGHEDEVIRGMTTTLNAHALRLIFLEMHFSALDRKGAPGASAMVVEKLQGAGFAVRWTDASHLVAEKRTPP
jgi:FkbM family methyltransferase